jgi:hypothetical protein
MKVKVQPMPYVDMWPKPANGWAFNAETKTMGLYQNGIKIQGHICDKDYPHDVLEEKDLFELGT